MPLDNILQKAKKQREARSLEQQRIVQDKLQAEEQEHETAKNAFTVMVYELVGDILRELEGDPNVERVAIDRDERISGIYDNLYCTVQIHHVVIKFGISDFSNGKPIDWLAIDGVVEDYSIYQRFVPPLISNGAFAAGREYVGTSQLHDFLMQWILGAKEEYDRLRPYFQEASAQLVKEKTTERLLAEYKAAIVKGVEASNAAIAELVDKSQIKIWTWPTNSKLEIFKIIWCCGGHWNAEFGKYQFDYDFGYSLSDRPNASGYYELLPMEGSGKEKRQVKPPAEFVTVEQLVVPDDKLPEELLVKVYLQVGVIDLRDSVWAWEQPNTFLPEFYPDIPDELPQRIADKFRLASQVERVEIGVAPCLPIRLAVDPMTPIADSDFDDSEF